MEEFNVGPQDYRGIGRFRFRVKVDYRHGPSFIVFGHAPDPSSALAAAFNQLQKERRKGNIEFPRVVAKSCSVECVAGWTQEPEVVPAGRATSCEGGRA